MILPDWSYQAIYLPILGSEVMKRAWEATMSRLCAAKRPMRPRIQLHGYFENVDGHDGGLSPRRLSSIEWLALE